MNKQKILKQELNKQGYLDVHSIFPTIQGEGPYAGQPATFIRLFGCNLQCPLCDTDYTSNLNSWQPERLCAEMVSLSSPNKLVVVTGGEPFRQNLTPFVNLLLKQKFRVQIETNGTLYYPDFPYNKVTIVCSPKTGKINSNLQRHIDAYKYVINFNSVSDKDGLPLQALEHPTLHKVARPPKNFAGPVYVQPADTGNVYQDKLNLQYCITSALTYGHTLCLQIHKIIGLN